VALFRLEREAHLLDPRVGRLGAGAAMGTAATAAAVAAGTTAVSEGLLTSVQADARRTGDELAERILRAYRERGWLAD